MHGDKLQLNEKEDEEQSDEELEGMQRRLKAHWARMDRSFSPSGRKRNPRAASADEEPQKKSPRARSRASSAASLSRIAWEEASEEQTEAEVIFEMYTTARIAGRTDEEAVQGIANGLSEENAKVKEQLSGHALELMDKAQGAEERMTLKKYIDLWTTEVSPQSTPNWS